MFFFNCCKTDSDEEMHDFRLKSIRIHEHQLTKRSKQNCAHFDNEIAEIEAVMPELQQVET